MKKTLSFMLTAALMVAFGLCAVSCSDDDDDPKTDENGQPLRDDVDPMDNITARTATRWLNALAGTDSLTADWQQKEYEPVIGEASQNNQLTRIVVVSDIDEAQLNFASIADVTIGELNATKTVSQDGLGTMTWTKSEAGEANIATVDVRINQMPRLRSIVYCTAEQVGKNGLFSSSVSGTAYYRFGDVVQDNEGYYWVCVRPAFEPNKEKSHWVNIFNCTKAGDNKPIPERYLQKKWNKIAKYSNNTIILPTKLPTGREHIYNLSNLMWAIAHVNDKDNPYQHSAAVNKGKGLGDLPYDYNGTNFLRAVANYWDEPTANGYDVWHVLFGISRKELEALKTIRLFYEGYSWTSGSQATLWAYNSTGYETKIHGSQKEDALKYQVGGGIDITKLAFNPNAEANAYPVGTKVPDGSWLVRVTTGDKLTNVKYSPYEGFTPTKEIYRYNAKSGKAARTPLETEATVQPVN